MRVVGILIVLLIFPGFCIVWNGFFSSSRDDDDYEDDDNDDNDNGKDTHDEYQHKIWRILLVSTHFERLSGLP